MEDEALLDCLLLSDMFHLLICVVFLGPLMYFREGVHCVPVFPFCHVSLIAHIYHIAGGALGEKPVMWRNFRFLCMTAVEKCKISPT